MCYKQTPSIYEGQSLLSWSYTVDTELDETHSKAIGTLVSRGSGAILVADCKNVHIAIARWLRDVLDIFSGTDKIRETTVINASITLLASTQITVTRY